MTRIQKKPEMQTRILLERTFHFRLFIVGYVESLTDQGEYPLGGVGHVALLVVWEDRHVECK